MSEHISKEKLKKKEVIADNARKFTLAAIDEKFLKSHGASSYLLIVDWIVTNEDREKKVVYKELADGEKQYFLIEKVTQDGNRTTDKKRISEEEYKSFLTTTSVQVEKRRYEFDFLQNDIHFALKYDVYPGNNLSVLEVDSKTEAERSKFEIDAFPYKLAEVTDDKRYQGYRVADLISKTK
jgi:hypothetical protein